MRCWKSKSLQWAAQLNGEMNREIKIFGKKINFELNSQADESVFEEVFVDRDYKVVDEIIAKSHCILDVGAHIGCFSVYCAALNEKALIFAYEPAPDNFSALKESLKVNHCNNVKCKNVAIAAESGVRGFNLSEDSHNHSFFVEGAEVKVQCLGVKQLLSRFDKVDLMKLDCEGAEFEILAAFTSEEFLKVKSFYIEYHEFADGMDSLKLADLLRKNGYIVESKKSHYDNRMGFLLARR